LGERGALKELAMKFSKLWRLGKPTFKPAPDPGLHRAGMTVNRRFIFASIDKENWLFKSWNKPSKAPTFLFLGSKAS
jgi:hypothetical protein